MLTFSFMMLLVLRGPFTCAAQHVEREFTNDENPYSGLRREATRATVDACSQVVPPCVTEADRFSLEALRHIHREMDDDQDGCIEVEESVEFIIEDMQQQQQTNKHSKLHREDQHITMEELWRGWKTSEVHNWTQEDILRWLREFVELPQYEKSFKEFRVNGNTLPRIASNEPSFMSTYLKIQDQQHKQKLKLKALDVVLFGPPTRPPHNWMKDLLLIVSVVMGVGGCWFAQAQNKVFKVHISKMMKDLESLQRAEQSLRDLQEQLERAQEEKRTVAVEKQFLEERMRDEIQGAQEEANKLQELRKGAASELSRLRYAEEELEQVRGALKKAELDMQVTWSVPESLQLWLQFTHEVELQYYNVKKQSAEQQLNTAKEEAEKIKKKRSSVFGTLHVAHSSSLDQVDQKILEAKNALAEVTASLRERLHRWQQIERLCGFPVMTNAGLASLTATLYPDPNWMLLPRAAVTYQMPASMDDMGEGMTPGIRQIPVTVTPIKLSPRTLVRSRRAGHIVPPPVILSPDPDLLIPIRTPIPRYGEEEGEHVIFPTLMKQECAESSSETESVGSSVGRMFTGSGLDAPPRRLYREEVDLFSACEREDAASRRQSRDEPGDFFRGSSRKVSREELCVETPSRKTSREELEALVEPLTRSTGSEQPGLAVDPRMVMRSLPIDITDSSQRLSNKEKLDSQMEPWNLGMRCREESDISVDIQRRKIFREKKDISGDSLYRVIPGDECETDVRRMMFREKKDLSGDSLSRVIPGDECETDVKRKMFREKKDLSGDNLSRMMPGDERDIQSENTGPYAEGEIDSTPKMTVRDDTDIPVEIQKGHLFKPVTLEPAFRKFLRDDFDVSVDSQRVSQLSKDRSSRMMFRDDVDLSIDSGRGKLFRGVSMDSGSRKKICNELDITLEPYRAMSLRERRDDNTSRKLSRDQRDIAAERRRLFRLDSGVEAHTDKMLDVSVETARSKTSKDEFPVAEPGHFNQTDLTVSSMMIWAPQTDPLSHLVYDGILEKSYQNPLSSSNPTVLSHAASISSMSTSSQSLVGSEGSVSRSSRHGNAMAMPPESLGEVKAKKTSKLKNLFKKKKEKEKDQDSPADQGSFQKL